MIVVGFQLPDLAFKMLNVSDVPPKKSVRKFDNSLG